MKRIIITLEIFISIMTSQIPLYGQVKQSHTIVLGFLQLKEQANLGMVFSGVQVEYRYGLTWTIQEHEITYQPKLGFGVGFNRGMFGVQLKFAPINVSWTVLLTQNLPLYDQNGHTIRAGANFSTDYSWQIYQPLQSGHLFYTSEIGISPIIKYNYQWDNKRIDVSIQNSLFGFTSHNQQFDPYWVSWELMDFVVTPHENMKFGTFNNYDHTNISIEFIPNIDKRHAFVYEFDYFGMYYGVQFRRLNHNLIWKMSL